jgi:hypothetical protein
MKIIGQQVGGFLGRTLTPLAAPRRQSLRTSPSRSSRRRVLPDRCAPLFPSPFAPRLNEGAHGVIVGEFHRAPADAGHYRTARPAEGSPEISARNCARRTP